MCTQHEKVTENSLIAFQGLVVGVGQNIEIKEIGRYIKHALEQRDSSCVKLACGIISDLSGSMEDRMNEYLDDFVPCLHEILKDSSLDRNLKLPALTALGDLCMYCGQAFNVKYLQSTLVIMGHAGRMAVTFTPGDIDTEEYLRELRETIIDQFIVILMAAGDTNCLGQFEGWLDSIFELMERTV
jgi:hypothetical protein